MKTKLSIKEQRAANRAAGRMYAGLFGKPVHPMDMEPLPRKLKPKKTQVQLPKRTEADVLRDVLSLLHRHPQVATVVRNNSGAAEFNGRHVKFHRMRINGFNSRGALMSDITGHLKNGKPFAIEVKAPDWKRPDFDALFEQDWLPPQQARELGQQMYLNHIRTIGGMALFATSVDQVIDALEQF